MEDLTEPKDFRYFGMQLFRNFRFFFIVAPVAMYFIYEQFVDIMIEPSSPR
jgi:hypothetical protein